MRGVGMDSVLKEMLRATADTLVASARNGTSVNVVDSTDYSDYCRRNGAKVAQFLNEVMVGRKASVRTVKLLTLPAGSSADLYLKVYTDGVPADDLFYNLTCSFDRGVFSIDVHRM